MREKFILVYLTTHWPGFVLVVDLSLTPRAGDVVVVVEREKFLIQEWSQEISSQMEVWGVVTDVLRAHRPREQ